MMSFEGGLPKESKERPYEYDALVVLGAFMEWNLKFRRWDFPSIIDWYVAKLVAGKARAIASAEAHDLAPVVIITGGSIENPETGEKASLADELAKLIKKYGAPEEKLVSLPNPEKSNTLGNIKDTIDYIESNPEVLQKKKIAILCPKFQYERAKLMFEQEPYFKEKSIEISWVIAEDMLQKRSPHYQQWIDKLYATPEAELNRQLEAKGVQDIKSGKYGRL